MVFLYLVAAGTLSCQAGAYGFAGIATGEKSSLAAVLDTPARRNLARQRGVRHLVELLAMADQPGNNSEEGVANSSIQATATGPATRAPPSSAPASAAVVNASDGFSPVAPRSSSSVSSNASSEKDTAMPITPEETLPIPSRPPMQTHLQAAPVAGANIFVPAVSDAPRCHVSVYDRRGMVGNPLAWSIAVIYGGLSVLAVLTFMAWSQAISRRSANKLHGSGLAMGHAQAPL